MSAELPKWLSQMGTLADRPDVPEEKLVRCHRVGLKSARTAKVSDVDIDEHHLQSAIQAWRMKD